jgi:hypothetical protein
MKLSLLLLAALASPTLAVDKEKKKRQELAAQHRMHCKGFEEDYVVRGRVGQALPCFWYIHTLFFGANFLFRNASMILKPGTVANAIASTRRDFVSSKSSVQTSVTFLRAAVYSCDSCR